MVAPGSAKQVFADRNGTLAWVTPKECLVLVEPLERGSRSEDALSVHEVDAVGAEAGHRLEHCQPLERAEPAHAPLSREARNKACR
eukprot:scaffold213530_cov26-Tisochrysis_lutea.AAC.1